MDIYADKSKNLEEIDKYAFLKEFASHETSKGRGPGDFTWKIFCNNYCRKDVKYYTFILTEEQFYKIYLAHHAHGDTVQIPGSGLPIKQAIEIYGENYNNPKFEECIKKVESHMKKIKECKDIEFIFFSNDKELAHEGHFNKIMNEYPKDVLFMGCGMHRLLALGLLLDNKRIRYWEFPVHFAYVSNLNNLTDE